ncbi:MAG: quinone-dependent dihydroorotate dehydrogenase [Bernardetiaceae bacterium]
MYQSLIRPLLFRLPAETAHRLSFGGLRVGQQLGLMPSGKQVSGLERTFWGLRFPSPLGLAAGFDKNAELVDAWAHFGFGFAEIGTVTPRPQVGNPRPRLFRLPQDGAIINRMGFNNDGLDAIQERLRQRRGKLILGGNIGKNKDTPNAEAIKDYLACMKGLFEDVDYFAVNVSSPNTPGLRDLQAKAPLTDLLLRLQDYNQAQSQPKPLLLKIAPDLETAALDDILDIFSTAQLSGLIATNTTIARTGLRTPAHTTQAIGAGGLSGKPLQSRSTEVIRYLRDGLPEGAVIVGVGGIHDATSAIEKLEAGADLLQVYTGFVYGGPDFVRKTLSQIKIKQKTIQ